MSSRKLLAMSVLLATLSGCAAPLPEVAPTPAPLTVANLPITVGLIGLELPVITGGERNFDGSRGSGSTGNSSGANTPGSSPAAPAAAPAAVPARGGSGGSGGGASTGGAEGITFAGYLDHPTYAGGSSGGTSIVATEAQLRAALADTVVTNIELSANIDLRTDGTTPDLEVARVVSISGRGTYCIAGDLVKITANQVSFDQLTVPGLLEIRGADDVQLRSCLLGISTLSTAVKVVSGIGTTLNNCTVTGQTGLDVSGGAYVVVQSGTVTADVGASVTGATLALSAGTINGSFYGIYGRNATFDIEETRFEGTGFAVDVFANSTGHSTEIDNASFVGMDTGLTVSGTAPIDVFVRDSRFTRTRNGIKINYTLGTWQATIAGNTFTANGVAATGIKVDRASTTLGYADAWRLANTFTGYTSGLEVVYP